MVFVNGSLCPMSWTETKHARQTSVFESNVLQLVFMCMIYYHKTIYIRCDGSESIDFCDCLVIGMFICNESRLFTLFSGRSEIRVLT